MGAVKGRPKPVGSGMKKGHTTKAKLARNQRVEWVISILKKTFERDVELMEPRDRARLFFDCMEYVQPKLSRIDMSANITGSVTIVASKEDINL